MITYLMKKRGAGRGSTRDLRDERLLWVWGKLSQVLVRGEEDTGWMWRRRDGVGGTVFSRLGFS